MTPGALQAQVPVVESVREPSLPHVIAWNLTRRCNLECAHCYIAAGPLETAANELSTNECLRILDEILEVNPAPLLILSGGEPLLRPDLESIAGHATSSGATVVVGTNGTLLDDARIATLARAGVSGVAVSVDSLEPRRHDAFRHGDGALEATRDAIRRLREHRIDVVIQTTAHKGNRHEIGALAAWAADEGAVSFNLYFLVATGRGARLADLSPHDYESLLAELAGWQREYRGRMLVRAKCAPQFMRHVHARDPESTLLAYETRCPCGVQYCRITPDGKVTPCPYIPTPAGDLRERTFGDIWRDSALFAQLRHGALGGKCGSCEYRRVCGGCRARALAIEGDVLAADPSCAYEPSGEAPIVVPPRAVTYGAAVAPALAWTPEARARLERIPSFVRGVITQRLESYARDRGLSEITPELMAEVRRSMPVDFSKRVPFFARHD